MGEWRRVTHDYQVKNGQRIRYYDGDCWENGTFKCGEDHDERFYKDGKSEDSYGLTCCDVLFSGSWSHVEAYFDEASSIPPKPYAATEPTHLGYEWDGVTYRDDHIGERTVAEHVAHIADIRMRLADANKQLRRYRTLEKRGLK